MAENKPFKFLQRQRIALFLAAAFLIAAVACGGSATPEPRGSAGSGCSHRETGRTHSGPADERADGHSRNSGTDL